MLWLLAAASLFIIALLLTISNHLFASQRQAKKHRRSEEAQPPTAGVSRCPTCGELLTRGKRVHSALFPGKADRMMHIFGCPSCYPRHEPIENPRKRSCPVCRKELKLEDYLIARVFPPRPGRSKPHVHVLGCTRCRERKT